jgi:MFS family permease
MTPATPGKNDLRPLLPLYLVIVIAFLGYSRMVTLFVPMLMHQTSGFLPSSATTAQRTMALGVLLALYPLGQFFGAPMLGALADRFGRKRVLLASLAVTTIGYVFICLALERQSLLLLAGSCLGCGLSEANITITQSAIADVSIPPERGRLFGYIWTMTSMSYIVGPIVGGAIAARYGYALPFWIVLGLLVVILVWTRAKFEETHQPGLGAAVNYCRAFTSLLTVVTDRPIRRLYGVNFRLYVAVFGFYRAILMYMVDEWQMPVSRVTWYYACLSVMSMVASFGVMPQLSGRVRMQPVTVVTAALGGLLLLAIVIPSSETSLLFTAGPTSLVLTLTISAGAA